MLFYEIILYHLFMAIIYRLIVDHPFLHSLVMITWKSTHQNFSFRSLKCYTIYSFPSTSKYCSIIVLILSWHSLWSFIINTSFFSVNKSFLILSLMRLVELPSFQWSQCFIFQDSYSKQIVGTSMLKLYHVVV